MKDAQIATCMHACSCMYVLILILSWLYKSVAALQLKKRCAVLSGYRPQFEHLSSPPLLLCFTFVHIVRRKIWWDIHLTVGGKLDLWTSTFAFENFFEVIAVMCSLVYVWWLRGQILPCLLSLKRRLVNLWLYHLEDFMKFSKTVSSVRFMAEVCGCLLC